jgi:hypothetical protein
MKTGRLMPLLFLCFSVCAGFADAQQSELPIIKTQFSSIRSWMRNDFSVPTGTESVHSAVGIVLRHHGNVLGQGTGTTLQEAVGKAFKEVRRQKIFQIELPASLNLEILNSISIELETCDSFVPSPHKNIDNFADTFGSGANGIAVRVGSNTVFRLPCILRLAPYRGIANIAESLCIDSGIHPAIAISHSLPINADITLYTLPCTTYFQERAVEPIVSLVHGDERVEASRIVPSRLIELADALASHLLASSGSGSVIGGYQPETDTFTRIFATHFVQILTADALYSYAQLQDAKFAKEAVTTALSILESIASDVRKSKSFDIESASLLRIMLHQTGIEKSLAVEELEAASEQLVLQTALHSTKEELKETAPFILALLCGATFAIEESSEEPSYVLPSMLCSLCCKATSPNNRASLIPWIIQPMLSFETWKPGSFATPLHEFLKLAKESQVDTDTIQKGGFRLQTNHGIVVDARGLRMIPMLAKLCQWKGGNASGTFHALSRSIGFLEQLTTRQARANRFSNPAMALGGIRKSSWDATMPTEATAMGLIGIVETLHTIKNIESKMK